MLPEKALKLIKEAQLEPRKGNQFVYSSYKRQLNKIPLSAYEYEKAVIALANALKV